MKIIRKTVTAIVECPLCNSEFKISGKDWRKVEENKRLAKMGDYGIHCPICKHFVQITPSEVKCKK